ncbi:GxxExxY protein [Sorangium sp. So ce1099]
MHYKGNLVGKARMDLVVDGQLVVELKATECIALIQAAQLLS